MLFFETSDETIQNDYFSLSAVSITVRVWILFTSTLSGFCLLNCLTFLPHYSALVGISIDVQQTFHLLTNHIFCSRKSTIKMLKDSKSFRKDTVNVVHNKWPTEVTSKFFLPYVLCLFKEIGDRYHQASQYQSYY